MECINKIGEIIKEYKHCHAELEVLLREQYKQEYTNSRQLAERIKECTRNAKFKLKNMRKSKELEITENPVEFERQKVLYEEEYVLTG